jgi:WD40 repeat protein
LRGHKFGIECLKFAPNNNFLISLGDPQDKGLFVWDWFNEKKLTRNLLSKPALTVTISENQDFFVTAGYQHLKFWYLDENTGDVVIEGKEPNCIMKS